MRDQSGHHFEYTLAAAHAFRDAGFSATILAHEDFDLSSDFQVQPVFEETWTMKKKGDVLAGLLWTLGRLFRVSLPCAFARRSFGRDLKDWLLRQDVIVSDIFVHTLNFSQLVQIGSLANQFPSLSFHLVLRQNPDDGKKWLKDGFLRFVFAAFKKNKNLFFYSDTRGLCARYESLSKREFRLLPILFDQSSLPFSPRKKEPLRITFLGDGRTEKGFQYLPQIVRETVARADVLFQLQVHLKPGFESDSLLSAAVVALREDALRFKNSLLLVEKSLTSGEYSDLLLSSDVVLIPYDSLSYRLRSSGILAQAMAGGKVAIVPCGTSLADEAPADLCRTYQSIDEIPRILTDLAEKFPKDQDRERARAQFCAFHSSANFVRQIELSNNESLNV